MRLPTTFFVDGPELLWRGVGEGDCDRLTHMLQHGAQSPLPATSRFHQPSLLAAGSCTLVTHTEVSNLEQNKRLVVVVVGGVCEVVLVVVVRTLCLYDVSVHATQQSCTKFGFQVT